MTNGDEVRTANPTYRKADANTFALHKTIFVLLSKVQIIVQPLPRLHLLNTQPRLSISQGSKVQETPHNNSKNATSGSPHTEQIRLNGSLTNRLVLLHGSLFVLCDGGVARGDVVEVDGVDVEDEFD
jgi:hypothetical protein